jgi:hypothetical protein
MGIVSDAAQPAGDVMRRLRELERRLDELSNARRLESSAVGAGGMRVNGGTLTITNPDGVTTCYFGPLGSGGDTSRGWMFRHDDDTPAFTLQGAPGRQFWAFWDHAGNIIASSDADSGTGLARPWIPLPTPEPTGVGHWPGTTSATWAAISRCRPCLQHPRITAVISTHADGGTAGDVRLAVDGDQIGPVAKAGDTLDFTAPVADFEFGREVTVEIQARRRSGGGEVRAITRHLYGRQS